ncbi:putative zinc-binding peptidase [Luteolibacter sp. SL250]|uniref:zinc-binding metallopeptidase family protein n=1 Tax=Luteolibacter sp. SL250 TaxID=2995170 RepID=UPI002270B01C|nr:putative zinc-binding peptidase [Luteolibacter sp. SL250]WAC21385.1 putative zinc-binding peptidase [Luteolibacter sp. SL250]
MNVYFCQHCGERLFFENTFCISCNHTLGFLPDRLQISVLTGAGGEWGSLIPEAEGFLYRKCRNYEAENACNWMIAADDPEAFCISCRLVQVIPDLSAPGNRESWVKMEAAKRRLIYSLLKLRLPVIPKTVDAANGLAFAFLADPATPMSESERILTGHMNGIITINLEEADDAVREKTRLNMREVYRTLLGHFRHECAHYYWDLLVRSDPRIDEVRGMFGDERADYGAALQSYYQAGPPADWGVRFVTPYAAAHPWEDWAETWSHYLHIMDTLESASAGGVEIRLKGEHRALQNPYGLDFPSIRENWHALRFVINSLNRSMGMADPYPFILSDAVTEKLAFIHHWISRRPALASVPAAPPAVQQVLP